MRWVLKALGAAGAAGAGAAAVIRGLDARRVERIRQALEREPSGETFSAGMVEDLPEPAQRYFRHAIAEGTPLARSVCLTMSGEIELRPGSWMPLTATETLAPGVGLLWDARAGSGLMRMRGADTYLAGEGRLRFFLLGLLPVVDASGEGVAKASIGRLAGESVWCPAGLLPGEGVAWEGVDDEHARATVTVDGEGTPLTLHVSPEGRVLEVSFPRYNSDQAHLPQPYDPYGMAVAAEQTLAGYTIPTEVCGGWGFGTEEYRETIRLRVENAEFH